MAPTMEFAVFLAALVLAVKSAPVTRRQCSFYVEETGDSNSCPGPCGSVEFCDKVTNDCVSCASVCSPWDIVRCGEVCTKRCPLQYEATLESLKANITLAKFDKSSLQALVQRLQKDNQELRVQGERNLSIVQQKQENVSFELVREKNNQKELQIVYDDCHTKKTILILILSAVCFILGCVVIGILVNVCLNRRGKKERTKQEDAEAGSKDSLLGEKTPKENDIQWRETGGREVDAVQQAADDGDSASGYVPPNNIDPASTSSAHPIENDQHHLVDNALAEGQEGSAKEHHNELLVDNRLTEGHGGTDKEPQ